MSNDAWWTDPATVDLDAPHTPERPKRRLMTTVALAAGGALTGAIVIAAASGGSAAPLRSAASYADPSSSAAASEVPDNDGPRGHHGGPGGPGRPGGREHGGPGRMLGMPIHGDLVVQKPDGTYQDVRTQQGAVTAVGGGSITVKSTDGYEKTYTVPSTVSLDGIAKGDTVHVFATLKDGKGTVVGLHEEGVRPNHPEPGEAAASPSATASA
jgi:hypothetical protein